MEGSGMISLRTSFGQQKSTITSRPSPSFFLSSWCRGRQQRDLVQGKDTLQRQQQSDAADGREWKRQRSGRQVTYFCISVFLCLVTPIQTQLFRRNRQSVCQCQLRLRLRLRSGSLKGAHWCRPAWAARPLPSHRLPPRRLLLLHHLLRLRSPCLFPTLLRQP